MVSTKSHLDLLRSLYFVFIFMAINAFYNRLDFALSLEVNFLPQGNVLRES